MERAADITGDLAEIGILGEDKYLPLLGRLA
jgi:hypothetical protein